MIQVSLNNVVVAEHDGDQDSIPIVEGNYYFPLEDIRIGYFVNSDTSSVCPWKGTASYYDLKVGETTVKDAAWYYPLPKVAAKHIKDHVAFYKNKVVIREIG